MIFLLSTDCPVTPFTNVVGSNGTFELDIPATPKTILQCLLTFISIYNDNKIEFKCSDIPAQTNMLVSILYYIHIVSTLWYVGFYSIMV
jgi:hypothetical protein